MHRGTMRNVAGWRLIETEHERGRWLELPLPQPMPLRRDDPRQGDVGEDEEDQERDGGRRVIVIDF